MRKPIVIAVAALAGCAATLYGWNWYTHGRFVETTDNATIDGDIVGIAAKVAGRVAVVAVGDNQPVHAGDVLLTIDDADYRAAVDQQAAALEAARAAVTVAEANLAVTRAAIVETRAQLRAAEAERTRASADLARYAKLNAAQYASEQRMQSARADAAKAGAEVERIAASLATQESRLALQAAERVQAQAEAEAQTAALDAARIRLADTVIRAPVDGVVGNRGVRLGQFLSAGQQAMSVVPVAEVYVVANFKETQVARMRPGQPVEIDVDAYKTRSFKGVVDSVSPGSGAMFSLLPPENATGNFTKIVQRIPVKIRLDRSARDALLIPGMSVEAHVDTRGDDAGLTRANAFARREAEASAPQTAAQR
ncbi:Secretion protein HlyD [uncultured Alphaproteobacteria bacterium]|uniref:Secretion protein HlyD n=1 Tax=uncultured Alphaproteobacteria bacterium TaxID=91750 RepID=A0A212J2F7_9PROT|nr:Secretion protein HlyD [uncultured Alphaproteobacteria bacterium]